MTINVISTDQTATVALSNFNTWVLNEGVNLVPDISTDADGMYGTDVTQAFIQLYGNIVTESDNSGNSPGGGTGIYMDGASSTNQIHLGKDASIFAGGVGITIAGSKNSISNSGVIDA